MKKPSHYRYWIIAISIFSFGFLLNPVQIVRANTLFIENQILVADDANNDARFGISIDVQGDTAVIGAPGALVNNETRGAAYVFKRQDNTWVQVARLVASNGASGDLFGTTVAIDGSMIVVGSPADDEAGGNAGAAYIFTESGNSWIQTGKLLPSQSGDSRFGFSVGVDGDTIAVGAPYTDSGFTNSGAVYIFEATNNGWIEAKRLASGNSGAVLSDLFGWSVALQESTPGCGSISEQPGICL